MSPQQHLEKELRECTSYELSSDEMKELERLGLKDFLFKQITRKKFRRWKLPDQARERIDQALDHCLSKEEPLTFRFRFGGYKLWRLDSAPFVDWAEFFTFAHYSRYFAPILAIYKPGVKMIFASDDVFVERLDNIPKSATEAYHNSFQKLLDEFRKFFPSNFSIDMLRHSSLYADPKDLEAEFKAKMKDVEEGWADKPKDKLEADVKTSVLNIKWDGVEDLTNLTDAEKQKKIERSAMMHDALVQLPTIRAFTGNNPGIISIFSTPFPSVVSIGTTKTSVTKFWVGTGVLEKKRGTYLDRILSPSQIEKIKGKSYEDVSADLIPLENFQKIRVYDETFNFVSYT